MAAAGFVREKLKEFLEEHAPRANLSAVDDVVLGYVAEVLSDVGQEGDSSFDIDLFVEMMAAYVPEFADVDSSTICEWVFSLASQQTTARQDSTPSLLPTMDGDGLSSADPSVLQHLLTGSLVEEDVSGTCASSRADDGAWISEGETSGERAEYGGGVFDGCAVDGGLPHSKESELLRGTTDANSLGGSRQQVEFLQEMFPDVETVEVEAVWRQSNGDTDRALQLLLAWSESRKTSEVDDGMCDSLESGLKTKKCLETNRDSDVKEFVLSRYSYVAADDSVFHRPVLHKSEEQKRIRYRDNQVVSTKGERFTVVGKRDKEGEDMKKTYVNLKPLRQYRFH